MLFLVIGCAVAGHNGGDGLRVLICAARRAPCTGLAIINHTPFVIADAFPREPLVMTCRPYLQVILICAPAILTLTHYAAPRNVVQGVIWVGPNLY